MDDATEFLIYLLCGAGIIFGLIMVIGAQRPVPPVVDKLLKKRQ